MRAKSRRERSTTLGQRHVAVRCGPAAMQGSLSTQAMSPLQSQCLLVSFSQILDRFHHHHLALRQHRHHLLVLLLQLPRLHSSRQPPFSTLPSVRDLGRWERDAARRRKRLCGSASGGWVRKDGGRGGEKKKKIARGLNLNVDSCHLVSSHAFRYRPHLAAVRLLACRGPRVSPAALTALQPDRLNILQQLWLRVPSCCPLAVGCVSIGGKGGGGVNVEWIPGERNMRGSGVWCACVSTVD